MAKIYNKWSTTDKNANITISADQYTASCSTGTGWFSFRSTQSLDEGKKYLEFTLLTNVVYVGIGIGPASAGLNYYVGSSTVAGSWGWLEQAEQVRYNTGALSTGMSASINDVIGLAVDLDNNRLYFSKNDSWSFGSVAQDPSNGTGGYDISSRTAAMHIIGSLSNYNTAELFINSGQESFSGTVPTGFDSGWYYTDYSAFYNGYTMLQGSPVSRTVRLYDVDTGALQDETTSSGNGYYSLETAVSGTHYIVCLDDTDNYNHLINKGVVSEEDN